MLSYIENTILHTKLNIVAQNVKENETKNV